MKLKLLETEYFKLYYPSDWNCDLTDRYIHSIYNAQGVGAIQISSYSSNDPEIKFDIDKERLRYSKAIIKDYNNFKAIHFIDSNKESSNYFIVKWIMGKDRAMIFCTYTVAKNDVNRNEFKKEIEAIENIINTIEIK